VQFDQFLICCSSTHGAPVLHGVGATAFNWPRRLSKSIVLDFSVFFDITCVAISICASATVTPSCSRGTSLSVQATNAQPIFPLSDHQPSLAPQVVMLPSAPFRVCLVLMAGLEVGGITKNFFAFTSLICGVSYFNLLGSIILNDVSTPVLHQAINSGTRRFLDGN